MKQIDNDGQFEYSPVVNVEVAAPMKYELTQNYPNPFNPSTNIKFTIPEAGLVKLSVFNLLGQEIKTLVDEQRQPGTYTQKFDATELNSGVYFYELRVNDFIQTKKMQFLK
ncbi:MAG: T9SS type A sorting domain-containing protein [Ignavibacteriales bacterium]|nr:T9SS type A sorting domain-containing protein [Ignavibacteriales bacterium]